MGFETQLFFALLHTFADNKAVPMGFETSTIDVFDNRGLW